MDLEFWIDEVERLYREGWKLQRAVLMVQLMRMDYEIKQIYYERNY